MMANVFLIREAAFIFKKNWRLGVSEINKKVFMVDFHLEVSEMSLSQNGWPRRKNCKNSYFLA